MIVIRSSPRTRSEFLGLLAQQQNFFCGAICDDDNTGADPRSPTYASAPAPRAVGVFSELFNDRRGAAASFPLPGCPPSDFTGGGLAG